MPFGVSLGSRFRKTVCHASERIRSRLSSIPEVTQHADRVTISASQSHTRSIDPCPRDHDPPFASRNGDLRWPFWRKRGDFPASSRRAASSTSLVNRRANRLARCESSLPEFRDVRLDRRCRAESLDSVISVMMFRFRREEGRQPASFTSTECYDLPVGYKTRYEENSRGDVADSSSRDYAESARTLRV